MLWSRFCFFKHLLIFYVLRLTKNEYIIMNILERAWLWISHLGINDEMPLGEQKSITILNRFLIGIFLLFTFLTIFNFIIYDRPIVGYAVSGDVFVALLGLILNYHNKAQISKILISIFFPTMIVLASAFAKSQGYTDNIILYLAPLLFIITGIMLPVVLFGSKKKLRLFLGLLPFLLIYFFYDRINLLFGIDYHDLSYDTDAFFVFKLIGFVMMIFISMGLIVIQNLNYLYEKKLQKVNNDLIISKQVLLQTNEELAALNDDLEEKNDLIQRNKEDLKEQNEELQAAEEELRQNNEELYTINDSLEQKTQIIEKQKNLVEQEKRKAQDASKYKSLFLANMSHEIRTPLNGIIGMTDILKETKLTKEQKNSLDIIDISGNSLLSIVNDILDYSKIEANQLELECIPFNLYREIESVHKMLGLKAQSKGLELSYSIHPDTPKFIKGDALRIKQILINYCNNSLKFTEKGFVNIDLTPIKVNEKHVTIKFSVKDTGMGISKDNQRKLFNDFIQVDASTTRKFGGTGLGLSISKKLALLMGGEVGLESELGKGSTFWFTGVYEIESSLEAMPIEEDFIKGDTKSLKILLVEDNLINQKVASHTIKKNGHELDVANDGVEAIKKFQENTYDLILMDIQMPNMNGYEATQAIRKIELEEQKEAIKIVAMTANALKGEREKCLELGMNGYLSKPFKQEALLKVINQ